MTEPDPIAREALRVYRRYAVEIVEALNLCPFAARARREGHVAERVLFSGDLETTLAHVGALARDPAVEIGLLLFPVCAAGRIPFEHFVARVRAEHEKAHPSGEGAFAMAAFHPDAAPDTATPERLVPFIRRTPDPTLQLVRRSALDRVRSDAGGTRFFDLLAVDPVRAHSPAGAPLRQRIARANLETVAALGVDEVARRLDDIRRDRDLAYAKLGRGA